MPIEPGDSWFSPKCIEVQPRMFADGGRALNGIDERDLVDSNQTANAISYKSGSETMGAKLHSREGNSPDHQLRSLSAD